MNPIIALSAALAAACAASCPAVAAEARDFPSRPVRIIVPFPPGGSVDVVTRIFSHSQGERAQGGVDR